MDNYKKFLPGVRKQAQDLDEQFFSATELLKRID
jgi:hypothetical protein